MRLSMAVDNNGYIHAIGVANPANHTFIMPVETTNDTLATRAFARANGGGSGSDSGVIVGNTLLKTTASTTIILKADTTVLATKSFVNGLTNNITVGHMGTSTIWGGWPSVSGDSLYLKSFDPTQFSTLSDSTIHFIGSSSSFTRQIITSGSSGTVTGNNYIVTFNPSSAIAAYNLTLPTSPTDLSIVKIEFGGTITAGVVVTSLTITGPVIDNTPPTSATADNFLEYQYNSTTSKWYRRKY